MTDNFNNRDFQARYLLGAAGEAEATDFEDAYFADDALFEQLNVREDELVDDYVRGRLAGGEREQFEAAFLNEPSRRRKVEVAARLFRAANKSAASAGAAETEPAVVSEANAAAVKKSPKASGEVTASGWRQNFLSFFRRPQFAAGFAALLILSAGAWLAWRASRTENNDLAARQTAPSPAAVNSPPTDSASPSPTTAPFNQNVSANQTNASPTKTVAPLPRPTTAPTAAPTPPPRQSSLVVLALAAGGVRSEGKTSELRLAPNVNLVRLELAFDAPSDYSDYAATVRTVDGKEIYRARAARRNSKNRATVEIPADRLARGDYIVTLSGANKSGAPEIIDEYFFSVVK